MPLPPAPHVRTLSSTLSFTNPCHAQWAPLCRGHLARPAGAHGDSVRSKQEKDAGRKDTGPSHDVDKQIIDRVEELAKKHDWKMSHVALAWSNKRCSSPIIGFSSVERIDEAIEAAGKELTAEEEKYLEELYEPKPVRGHL